MVDLFFSEYIEGTSNNKALEIYNGTGVAIDLAAEGYVIQTYFNGATTAGTTINLLGTIADGDVFVFAHSAANATILAQADQTYGFGWYNGNDAIVLRKGGSDGTIVDVIGQIGFDPGAEWGTGLTSTADNTLRRKAGTMSGDTDPTNAFDPSLEWDGFATDTVDGLGSYFSGASGLPLVSIAAIDAYATEAAQGSGTFRISRTGDTSTALAVSYTIAGQATNGTDYTPSLTGTATIPAGSASIDITVTPIDDALVEGNESIILTLQDTATYDLGNQTTAEITIADNDSSPTLIRGTTNSDRLVGTTGNDIMLGLGGNDSILAGAGQDVINGGLGADTLTGGTGGDRFLYQGRTQAVAFANSKLPQIDRITDFNAQQGDRIQLDYENNLTTPNRPKALFNAGTITAQTLVAAVQAAYADKNRQLGGKQPLLGNEAVFFSWQNKTYLGVNNAVTGFSPQDELLLEVGGLFKPGDTLAGVLAVKNYFI